jgi:uncharacterized protein YjbI with pentapeptide repeats
MARKMTEWPSKRGPIAKIMPSDGCEGGTVPLAVGQWYDFHEFGCHLGNVGLLTLFAAACLGVSPALAACTDPPGPGVNWQRCAMDGLDLIDVDLSGARLRDASFFRTDLSGSNLSDTESYRAKFVNATLHGVSFDGAKLYEADLTKADLSDASMVGVDLRQARLYRANLRNANLTDALLKGADLARTELSGATWTDGKRVCSEGSVGRCN